MHTLKLSLLAAALGLSLPAHALTNGSFETGLSGWETLGDVTTDSTDVTYVSQGSKGVFLGTASVAEADDAPFLGAGEANFSCVPAAPVGLAGGLEDFIGLPMGSLDPDPANAIAAHEGSALKQTFAVNAGDTLSFDWMFATIDQLYGDYAFVAINGNVTRLGDLASITSSNGGIFVSTPATFSLTFAQSGSVSFALGVVDVGDTAGTSALLVDNVRIAPVPEPETYAMMLAGLGLLGALARRKR